MKKTLLLLALKGFLASATLINLTSCADNVATEETGDLLDNVLSDSSDESLEENAHTNAGMDEDVRELLEQAQPAVLRDAPDEEAKPLLLDTLAHATGSEGHDSGTSAVLEITQTPSLSHADAVAKTAKNPAPDKEGANAVLDALDRSNQEQEAEIAKLKSLLAAKDKRILEYRRLNEDLKARNKELRQAMPADGSVLSMAEVPNSIEELKKELANSRMNFAMRTKDWYDSQEQLRSLEEKVRRLEVQLRGGVFDPVVTEPTVSRPAKTNPPDENAVITAMDPSPKLQPLDPLEEKPSSATDTGTETTVIAGTGRLQFEAAVTDTSGKTREAFYTEFFVTKNHLDDVLKGVELHLSDYKGIASYSELWARVRKNEYSFPGLQRRIREALLSAVDADQGRRIRTNSEGVSPDIDGLAPGSYFIIGSAPLGQVGVTWSLPIVIESRNDKRVVLTLNNSSWSQ